MNAIPQITVRPIERPVFDNTHLDNESRWCDDNAAALARYWQQLGRALGLDERDGEEDLSMWLAQQHTEEWNRVDRAKRCAEAIARIGTQPPQEYRAPRQSEREAEELHQQEQWRKLK